MTVIPADKQRILVTIPLNYSVSFMRAASTRKSYRQSDQYARSLSDEQVINNIARRYDLHKVSEWPIDPLNVRCIVYEIPDKEKSTELLAQLNNDPEIESAQAMNTFYVRADAYNDPYYKLQHGAHNMQLADAHKISKGKGIKVAIVDTGIDVLHTELNGKVIIKKDFVSADFHHFETDIHGTAVAGIIASLVDNHIGIVGIAPQVDIIALKACQQLSARASAAVCNSFTLAQAISFAIEQKVDLINLSLTGPADPLLQRLLEAALKRGIIIVTAFDDCNTFPAMIDDVIVTDSSGNIEMKYCQSLVHRRVMAPGLDVMTTIPGGNFTLMSGNSFAAAHTSGVIALLLEHDNRLTPSEIIRILNSNSTAQTVNQANNQAGGINACEALLVLTGTGRCEKVVSKKNLH